MSDRDRFRPDFAVTLATGDGDGKVAIEVQGELDSGSCEELLATAERALSAGPPELTLDLSQMTFVDSAGMRALIMIERLAAEHRVALTVTPAPEHVTELLRTAGMVDRSTTGDARSSAEGRFLERTEIELPRDPHSPARARAEVRERASDLGQPDEQANLVLLTSELVTNAVIHPRGAPGTPIALRIIVYAERVRIEVEDCGQGFTHPQPMPPGGERGRGLFLVDRFSDRWGSGRVQTGDGPRFRVWFELRWREQGSEAVA